MAAIAATGDAVESILVWDADIDKDGRADRIVQTAFTPGGNGWYTRFFVFPPEGSPGEMIEFTIDGVYFDRVYPTPDGPMADLRRYDPDDGRCCPSIVDQMSLRLEDLNPA